VGDLIIRINDRTVSNWEEVNFIVDTNPSARLRLDIEREGVIVVKELVPEEGKLFGRGYAGLQPEWPPIIKEIIKGDPADLAGLKKDDLILAIDGEEMRHWLQMAMTIWKNPDRLLTFKVKRGQEILSFSIRPKAVKAQEKTIGLIGISNPGEVILKQYGPLEAIARGGRETWELTKGILTSIWKVIVGKISHRAIGGPILIFQATGWAAKLGITQFMRFMAGLSIMLAIVNTLPIPILDGGHLLFLGIEAIRRKPISARTREFAYRAGLVIIIMLMVFVFYNDISRFFLRRG
jgi:regulator of sigma E protease